MSQVCRMLMQHLSPQIVICVHGRSIFDPRFQNVPLSLVRGGGPQANAKGSLPTNTLGTRSRHVLRLSQWERLLQPLLPFWWLRVMRIAFGILNDLFFSHFSAWIRTHHLRNPNPWYRLAKKKRATNKNHQLRHILLSYICIQIYFRTPRLKPSPVVIPSFPTISRQFKLRPFRLDLETSAPLKVLKAETARVLGFFQPVKGDFLV